MERELNMKKTVLFVILDKYADWEYAFLAASLQGSIMDKTSPYDVRTVSVTKDPIMSIGGFTTIPDHDVSDVPDHDGIVLIGGMSWRTEDAKKVVPLVKDACSKGKVVGAICDATVFMGMNGMLNDRKHTSNTLGDLSAAAGSNYTGSERYVNEQAVRDGNLVTANGTAYLEFCKEMLVALDAYPQKYIDDNYQYFKIGHVEMVKKMDI